MAWQNHISKMRTALDALDEIVALIEKDASPEELNRWLERVKRAGHVGE